MTLDSGTQFYQANRHCFTLPDNSVVSCSTDSKFMYGTLKMQFLNTDGSVGTPYNADGDYSTTSQEIYVQPPDGKSWIIESMSGYINTTTAPSTLSNGVRAYVKTDDVESYDMLGGLSIITRTQWALFADRYITLDSALEGKIISVNFSFHNVGNIILRDNQKIAMLFQDDMSFVNYQYWRVLYTEV